MDKIDYLLTGSLVLLFGFLMGLMISTAMQPQVISPPRLERLHGDPPKIHEL